MTTEGVKRSTTDISFLLPFIREDAPFGDITSDAVIGDEHCRAVVIAKENGVISGLDEAGVLFRYFGLMTSGDVRDGDTIHS